LKISEGGFGLIDTNLLRFIAYSSSVFDCHNTDLKMKYNFINDFKKIEMDDKIIKDLLDQESSNNNFNHQKVINPEHFTNELKCCFFKMSNFFNEVVDMNYLMNLKPSNMIYNNSSFSDNIGGKIQKMLSDKLNSCY
jgi:hypothetical protein